MSDHQHLTPMPEDWTGVKPCEPEPDWFVVDRLLEEWGQLIDKAIHGDKDALAKLKGKPTA